MMQGLLKTLSYAKLYFYLAILFEYCPILRSPIQQEQILRTISNQTLINFYVCH